MIVVGHLHVVVDAVVVVVAAAVAAAAAGGFEPPAAGLPKLVNPDHLALGTDFEMDLEMLVVLDLSPLDSSLAAVHAVVAVAEPFAGPFVDVAGLGRLVGAVAEASLVVLVVVVAAAAAVDEDAGSMELGVWQD